MSDDGDVRRQTLKTSGCRKARSLKGLKNVFVLGLILCLSVTPHMTRAQGEPPPVLDPADIFTDAVEVVETLPILNADNAARMLWYFDPAAGEWRGYAYPEGVEEIKYPYIIPRTDGTFIVTDSQYLISDGRGQYLTPLTEYAWVFDPSNEEIARPESVCGTIKDLSGEGRWIVYQNPNDNLYYLCLTETGDLSNPLHQTVQQKLCPPLVSLFWKLPVLSPDGDWLIFNECKTNRLYATELTTGQTNYLGTLEDDNLAALRMDNWIDTTAVTIRVSSFGPGFRNYVYLADLTQPNSLELIAQQFSEEPRYYDDLPRYIWDGNETLLHESFQRGWQEIHEYNVATHESRTLIHEACGDDNGLYSVCCPSSAIPNNSGLLAVLSTCRMGMFQLVTVFDLNTGEKVYEATASNPSNFVWQGNTTFSYVSNVTDGNIDTTHFITITNGELTEITLERPIIYFSSPDNGSPDGNFWLTYNYHSFNIYELNAERNISILHVFDTELYHFTALWQGDRTLLVEMSDNSGYINYGAWIVRLR